MKVESTSKLNFIRYAKILMKEGEEEAYRQVWAELENCVKQNFRSLKLGTWNQKIRLREASSIMTSLSLYWQVSFAINVRLLAPGDTQPIQPNIFFWTWWFLMLLAPENGDIDPTQSFLLNMMMPYKGRRVGGEEPGEQWRRIFPAQVIQHGTSFTFTFPFTFQPFFWNSLNIIVF